MYIQETVRWHQLSVGRYRTRRRPVNVQVGYREAPTTTMLARYVYCWTSWPPQPRSIAQGETEPHRIGNSVNRPSLSHCRPTSAGRPTRNSKLPPHDNTCTRAACVGELYKFITNTLAICGDRNAFSIKWPQRALCHRAVYQLL